MARFKFRIGTKLGVSAGISILLVGGMLTNQLTSNREVIGSSQLVVINGLNKADAQAAEMAMLRAQLALRDIGAALSDEALDAGLRVLRESAADAGAHAAAAGQRALRQVMRDLYREIKGLIEGYAASGAELAAAQKAAIAGAIAAREAGDVWMRASEALLESPQLDAAANRLAIEAGLRHAGTSFNAARAAAWRYAVTFKPENRELVSNKALEVIEALKRARQLTGAKELVAEIDGLIAATDRFKVFADEAVNAEFLKARIANERIHPAAAEIALRIDKAVGGANEMLALRQSELLTELSRVAMIALGVGMLVVLTLVGSALFSVLTIARPIRRIGEVLLELARGNKAVEIPFTGRGDEVGDNARAALTFKDNLIQIEKMEAEQKDQQAAVAAQRKAEMIKLADAFQASVGGIVSTVSAASHQLEAAAGTLSGTAAKTQELSSDGGFGFRRGLRQCRRRGFRRRGNERVGHRNQPAGPRFQPHCRRCGQAGGAHRRPHQ